MSTVLTALLAAAGLALPGIVVLLSRSTPPPVSEEPAKEEPHPREDTAPVASPSEQSAPSQRPPSRVPEPSSPPPKPPSLPLLPEQAVRLRALAEDETLPPLERSAAALSLLDAHWTRQRWRSLARDAERISQLGLPIFDGRLPDEHARWTRITALWNLKEWDATTQEGESFLRLYPDSLMAGAVGTQLRNVAYNREYEQQCRKDDAEKIRKAEQQAALDIAEREKRGEPAGPIHRKLALLRCSVPVSMFYQEALTACRAFQKDFGAGSTPEELDDYRDARGMEIRALVGLRRYSEARRVLAEFLASDPDGDQRVNAGLVVRSLPPDAEE